MELPKAVQEQLKRAEEEAKKAMEQGQVPQAVATAQEPPAAQEPPQQPQPAEQGGDEWKKRFETLQGKYNAEVPRLHQQLQQAQEFARQLAQELAEIKQTQEQLKESQVSEESLVSQDDIDAISEAYGDDIIEFVDKMINDRLRKVGVTKLKEQVDKVMEAYNQLSSNVSTVGETQQQVAAQQIVQQLRARIPEFDQVNNDPAFAEWLQAEDPVSGLSRLVIVQDAFSKLDVDRLERLFRLFMDESGFARRQQEQVSRQTAVAQQVTPESIAGSNLLTAADLNDLSKKIWTQAEYVQVYDPRFVREVGEERAAQLQAAADQAVAEGRIR